MVATRLCTSTKREDTIFLEETFIILLCLKRLKRGSNKNFHIKHLMTIMSSPRHEGDSRKQNDHMSFVRGMSRTRTADLQATAHLAVEIPDERVLHPLSHKLSTSWSTVTTNHLSWSLPQHWDIESRLRRRERPTRQRWEREEWGCKIAIVIVFSASDELESATV